MCQKLWKLAGSRQSYYKKYQAYFFGPTLYIIQDSLLLTVVPVPVDGSQTDPIALSRIAVQMRFDGRPDDVAGDTDQVSTTS